MFREAVDDDRIFTRLDELATIGENDQGGVTRLAYSDAENEAIAYIEEALPTGYSATFDVVGNFFAAPDQVPDESLLLGSHLDSVYNGGPLDGALGVIVALEAIEVAETVDEEYPIPPTLTVFRGEESARFGRGTIGSRAATGKLTEGDLEATDKNGVVLRDAIREAGFEPSTPGSKTLNPGDIHAFAETHIEQGPVLESSGNRLGIVTSIRAPVRYAVEVTGEYDHSGATPMGTRRDAIAAASEIVTAVESLGLEAATEGNIVATVTEFDAHDTASNKICGRVSLTIDLRSIDHSYRDRVEDEIVATIRSIADEREINVNLEPYYRQDPVPLEDRVIDALEQHADAINTTHERLPSGGGHDGRHLQSIGIPSGMLFVPSINGVSHSPDEETIREAVVDAAAVFSRAIINGL